MLYYKRWQCGPPPPDDLFKKPQMAVWLFAASFIFDSFRQDFRTDFRKSCRKLLNYFLWIFPKQKILSGSHRKIRRNLFSVETYCPAHAPPLKSDIKIHFRFSEVNRDPVHKKSCGKKFFRVFFRCTLEGLLSSPEGSGRGWNI